MELAEQMQSDLDIYVREITKNNNRLQSNGSLPSGLQDNIKKHARQKAS